jgi:hypothetical protein
MTMSVTSLRDSPALIAFWKELESESINLLAVHCPTQLSGSV